MFSLKLCTKISLYFLIIYILHVQFKRHVIQEIWDCWNSEIIDTVKELQNCHLLENSIVFMNLSLYRKAGSILSCISSWKSLKFVIMGYELCVSRTSFLWNFVCLSWRSCFFSGYGIVSLAESVWHFETAVWFKNMSSNHPLMQCHIPEEQRPQLHCCQSLKSCVRIGCGSWCRNRLMMTN